MRAECDRRKVAWRWDVQGPAPEVELDRVQMEQVLVNVVKNALEAIGESGTFDRAAGSPRRPALRHHRGQRPRSVPEAQAQLFTPFFTTKENGQGIGLTLVQQILTQHRFDYALESPPGGPTQFTILF
jgi:nitrogen-specific signal transduction histidine kinase